MPRGNLPGPRRLRLTNGEPRETFAERLDQAADMVTVALDALLPPVDGPEGRLLEAMRYAALGPGKRMRPFFFIEAGRLLEIDARSALRGAAAVECLHAYSLIHDDLPAMDDDELRRGQPTVHVEYGEATAILAGDALQAMAFEILAHEDTHESDAVRAALCQRLAQAAGAMGMVGGQMIDMGPLEADLGLVARMQRMKTGAIINFCFEGPILMSLAEEAERNALLGYAQNLGLAYQIADDILDAEGDPKHVGKATQKDVNKGKANFVTLLGLDEAKSRMTVLADQAKDYLSIFGEHSRVLCEAVDFVLDRDF